MKHTFFVTTISLCLCCAVLTCGQENKALKKYKDSHEENFGKDASYAMGMDIGEWLNGNNINPDIDEFIQGMMDILTESETRFTYEEKENILRQAFFDLDEQGNAENREAENEFLAENSKKPGIHTTGTGLQYEIITEGNGPKPAVSDTVRANCKLSLTNGTVLDIFDSPGEPVEFPLKGEIEGLTEGLQLMNVGGKYRLFIPSDLGFGVEGVEELYIPPYATLIVDVELLDIIHNN